MILAGMFAGGSSLEARVQRMFAGGLPGLMIDPTRMGYCYQDAARTTLVNAMGQGIGSTEDLSGNGKHPAQATATGRPLYQGYADLDGVDDFWVTPVIDFTRTDSVTVVAAVRKRSDSAAAVVCELTENFGPSRFTMFAPGAPGPTFAFASRGDGSSAFASISALPAPRTAVLSGRGNIAVDLCELRINGALAASSAADQGGGNYSNAAIYIGRRGISILPFNGGIYRLAVFGRLLTPAELPIAEQWADQPVGVLP